MLKVAFLCWNGLLIPKGGVNVIWRWESIGWCLSAQLRIFECRTAGFAVNIVSALKSDLRISRKKIGS